MGLRKVVGISFDESSRKYYFDANDLNIRKNLTVIVETERGLQFGKAVTNVIEMDEKNLFLPLKKVLRLTTKKDYIQHLNNLKDAEAAKKKCIELIEKEKLDMKVINANYTFERTQLYFSFMSSGRVDFRELAKKLAAIYKVRIELRQIGPRDKAKEIGGLGPCGRPLCCSQYLYTFSNITINMAKNQNIALNPSKINGACNRLLCCLEYEDGTYTEYKKNLPKVGETIKNSDVEGKVISVDILGRRYKIETPEKNIVELES